ncbi:MAG TPA: phenylalanine--tRNA ligase subunit alpha, partial [Clostridia bacterium]|nr:phenylalanine--tRNA ligase subunit alpha [Clostridia bacterium]
AAQSSSELESVKVKYLGKKGELTYFLRGMGSLPADERPKMGQKINLLREELESAINEKAARISSYELELKLKSERIDVTIPAKRGKKGGLHPLSIVLDDILAAFFAMGFEIAEGPEIETDYYNFQALNIPPDHPARDMQDTFYITDNILLRTQTSAAQARIMEKKQPPIRVVSPGRVFRADEVDATHSPIFHQVEGLVVDKGINMCDLRGVLDIFAKSLYGPDTKTRFRPSFFPFTEPSAEVDVRSSVCKGAGCKICKNTGWIEILGAGMVHPKVLSGCGIDPEVYSGFAFGLGLDRITVTRYGITDMRMLFENDLRFLEQF